MSLLEKVRNFFYDEEYEEPEIEKPHHKEKKEKIKIREHKEDKMEKQEISERELFEAERTFNFPMDIYEEENIPVKKEIKEQEEIKEEKEVKKYKPKVEEPKETSYNGIRTYARYEERKEELEAPKKFIPTPVISPIYGILDKNYKKEDLIMDATNEYETTKKVDYDTVRRKAYGDIYKKTEDDSKGIFFNLEEESNEEDATEDEEDVKITYNDVTPDDEDITIGEKIEAYEKEQFDEDDEDDLEPTEEKEILSETKEQDLFNLIDNMYNSEDDEDEEDE